jgi:hypothetical protein
MTSYNIQYFDFESFEISHRCQRRRRYRYYSPGEGANFCKNEKGAWFEIGDYNARENVSALLRDLLPTDYRSSAKAKTTLRRAAGRKQNATLTQHYGQQLVESTRHSEVSSIHSTDFPGFAKSLELDFFDIDDVF